MQHTKLLLIDGDEMLFKASAAVEHESKFNTVLGEQDWSEPPIHVLFSHPGRAREVLDEMLERYFERFETRNHFLCFSTPADFRFGLDVQPNFRFDVDPTYKNNRQNSRKPMCYAQLRMDVEKDYTCKNFIGLEADDVMGILATMPGKGQRIIISQDKDMQTIPTQVWRKGDLVTVTEAEADYFHMYQTLTGDITDGYKGCPGIGKVKAEKLLKDAKAPGDTPEKGEHWETEGKLWPRVVHAYKKAGLTEEDALRQARLARILRWEDWDNEKKQPILWTP
jgi:DNA polymerase-1